MEILFGNGDTCGHSKVLGCKKGRIEDKMGLEFRNH
jgi:hypothetical protein